MAVFLFTNLQNQQIRMKIFISILMIMIASVSAKGQAIETKIYNPYADAAKEINEAKKKAKAEKKNILIQAGGNWCGWCIEFNHFCKTDPQIDSILKADYIIYHLNYSPENKNEALMAKYGYPQRFGFPVFLILDENGTRLHTQNSAYLEQGRSYSKQKVMEFLEQWNRKSVTPATAKSF
jgi:thioredoxin-related protein